MKKIECRTLEGWFFPFPILARDTLNKNWELLFLNKMFYIGFVY